MSNERLMMEGKLSRLKQEQKRLRSKAKGLCKAIAPAINHHLHAIEKMDIAIAAGQMDDLVMAQAKLLRLKDQIEELEDALGN